MNRSQKQDDAKVEGMHTVTCEQARADTYDSVFITHTCCHVRASETRCGRLITAESRTRRTSRFWTRRRQLPTRRRAMTRRQKLLIFLPPRLRFFCLLITSEVWAIWVIRYVPTFAQGLGPLGSFRPESSLHDD
jgi:hypothetical protein